MRIMFQLRKIFKAYYGFRVLYVFTFPSAGHGPTGSGRDIEDIAKGFTNSISSFYVIFDYLLIELTVYFG